MKPISTYDRWQCGACHAVDSVERKGDSETLPPHGWRLVSVRDMRNHTSLNSVPTLMCCACALKMSDALDACFAKGRA